jgi:hypothetical protein
VLIAPGRSTASGIGKAAEVSLPSMRNVPSSAPFSFTVTRWTPSDDELTRSA